MAQGLKQKIIYKIRDDDNRQYDLDRAEVYFAELKKGTKKKDNKLKLFRKFTKDGLEMVVLEKKDFDKAKELKYG